VTAQSGLSGRLVMGRVGGSWDGVRSKLEALKAAGQLHDRPTPYTDGAGRVRSRPRYFVEAGLFMGGRGPTACRVRPSPASLRIPKGQMKSWNVNELELKPHAPQILSSTKDARALALAIPAGESLQDHQVHERAWVSILSGEAEITTPAGEHRNAGAAGGVRSRRAPRRSGSLRHPPAAAADPVARRRASRTNVARRQRTRGSARGRARRRAARPVRGARLGHRDGCRRLRVGGAFSLPRKSPSMHHQRQAWSAPPHVP